MLDYLCFAIIIVIKDQHLKKLMKDWDYALQNFDDAISRDEYLKYASGEAYAEADRDHFQNIVQTVTDLWKARFEDECPLALKIAALYHDFDRVFPPEHSDNPNIRTERRMIDTKSVPTEFYGKSDEEIKTVVHPRNCAAIFRDYNPRLAETLQSDISYIIERHEVGGDEGEKIDEYTGSYDLNKAADALCEADGISFFRVVLNSYVKGRTAERIRKKIRFSFRKLSPVGQKMVKKIDFHVVEYRGKIIDINKLFWEVLKNDNG